MAAKTITLDPKPSFIISRTDNIGDVVLTLPLAALIRHKYPDASLLFLGKKYMRPLIESCEHINRFLDWDDIAALAESDGVQLLKSFKASVILHVFPHPQIAALAYKARIPYRIGTSHRSYHWLYCNKLVNFTRKKSTLHEAQLNVKLAAPIGIKAIPSAQDMVSMYGLTHVPAWQGKEITDNDRFNLILHPKSRGSAREWAWEHWNKLAEILPPKKVNLFVTGTENEGVEIRKNLLKQQPHITDLTGKLNLSQLIAFIAKADGLVACSTGPLHIAAALNKRAIGIYPSIKPMHPGRWAPLGKNATYLALNKTCSDCRKGDLCTCINSITPEQIKALLPL